MAAVAFPQDSRGEMIRFSMIPVAGLSGFTLEFRTSEAANQFFTGSLPQFLRGYLVEPKIEDRRVVFKINPRSVLAIQKIKDLLAQYLPLSELGLENAFQGNQPINLQWIGNPPQWEPFSELDDLETSFVALRSSPPEMEEDLMVTIQVGKQTLKLESYWFEKPEDLVVGGSVKLADTAETRADQ